MVEYINVPSSWNIRSNIPKEVLNICKKLNVYLPCYLYGECLGDIIFLNKKPDFFQIISVFIQYQFLIQQVKVIEFYSMRIFMIVIVLK